MLVVPVGAKEHSVVGLDPEEGRLLWSHGSDRIEYATPVILESGERRQLVVAGSLELVALDPKSENRCGAIGTPKSLPSTRPIHSCSPSASVCCSRSAIRPVLYDVATGSERYRSHGGLAELGLQEQRLDSRRRGDHLYGFNGKFLTCAELETGEVV